MRRPKLLLVGAVAVLATAMMATGFLNNSAASTKKKNVVLASAPTGPWHITGWQFGTTTTTTTPPPPPTTAPPQPKAQATGGVRHTQRRSTAAPVTRANTGDFASCVRQHESGGNYSTNTGNGYHGAYQMTNSHWGGYGGYSSADQAPPEVQDQKFHDDMSHGSGYMHQQYPQTSRACGG